MADLAPSLNPIRADAPEEIPILDLGPYLAGKPNALEQTAAELRYAFENIGFYFIVNHGVERALVDQTFEAARRFHARSMEEKIKLRFDEHTIGYLPIGGSTIRQSKLNAANKPNQNESYFIKRDLPADHPDVIAKRPFRGMNHWPANLPGFRETALAYTAALEGLAQRLLPLYAVALGLKKDWFKAAFTDPMFTQMMIHYPRQEAERENEFGLAPHTDTSFMTLLAQNRVPGLAIRMPTGRWVDAPHVADSFLVNGGDIMRRWTNERFLATPHRVVNRSGEERYAIPFFIDCNYNWRMECIPTCQGPGNPARYEPITYADYIGWSRNLNYAQSIPPTAAQ
ncbi:MAG: isopenicillin N synthase family oxygenase [Proteobacteria bacterium]|nr:isopenicillin N synthase family oxygenase [Pseudomonadota bacterium]